MLSPEGENVGESCAPGPAANRRREPSWSRSQMSAFALRPRTNAIVPFLLTAGSLSGSGASVTLTGIPVAPSAPTATRQMSKLPERSEENTRVEPSGVQAGSRSQAGPAVTRVNSLSASDESPATPCGISATQRSPFNSNASRPVSENAGLRTPAWSTTVVSGAWIARTTSPMTRSIVKIQFTFFPPPSRCFGLLEKPLA